LLHLPEPFLAFLRPRRAVSRSRTPKRTTRTFPHPRAEFVSPRQRSWASTFRALLRPEIEARLRASSSLAVAGHTLAAHSASKGYPLREAATDRSQPPALLAFVPSEVLPLAATPHSFLRAPLTRFEAKPRSRSGRPRVFTAASRFHPATASRERLKQEHRPLWGLSPRCFDR
jgi:hypothetical protein